MNEKKFVIADVHGCYKTLMALIEKLPEEANASNIIFLGDLIDRGPDSLKVIDFVKNGEYDCVIGNHEQLMIDGLEEYTKENYHNMFSCWMGNGGDKTFDEYRNKSDDSTLISHIEWFKTLPFYKTYKYSDHKDLLVSHAPSVEYIDRLIECKEELSRPQKDLSQKDIDSLNMELDSFYEWITWHRMIPQKGSEKYFGISGHNVWNKKPEADIENKCIISEDIGFASIDTGSCFPENGYRTLTCIEYPSLKLYQQDLLDDVESKNKQEVRKTHKW